MSLWLKQIAFRVEMFNKTDLIGQMQTLFDGKGGSGFDSREAAFADGQSGSYYSTRGLRLMF
jgi:hypothetical protein